MQYLGETGFKALLKLIKTKLVAKSRLNNNSILKYVYGDIQEALSDEDYVKPVHYHTNAQLTNYNWFSYSSTAPTNTNLLWIDPKEGLKYHNGSTWVIVPIGFYESIDTTVTTYTLSGSNNIGSVTVDGVATTLPATIGEGDQVVIKSSSYNSDSYTMTPNFSISTTYQTSNTTGTSAVKTISFIMPAYNLTVGFTKKAVAVTTYKLTKGSNIFSIKINDVIQSSTRTSFDVAVGATVQITSNTFDSGSQAMTYNGTSVTMISNTIVNNQRVITFRMPSKDITVKFALSLVGTGYTITFGSGVAGVSQNTSGTLYEAITSGTSVPAGTKLMATYKNTSTCTKDSCLNNMCLNQSCGQSVSAVSVVEPMATTYTYRLYLTNNDTGKKTLTATTTSQTINFTMPEYNCTVSITRTTGTCQNMM